ncbi:hypothetical protein RQP46_008409 [Phenoliferia psychrophenolica]
MSASLLTIDSVVDLVEQTALNPFFALLLPALLLLNAHDLTSPTILIASLYAVLVTIVALVRLSATAWTNKPGRSWLAAARCSKSLDWSKQVVVVTGAAGGVGRVLVSELERKGAAVVAIDVVARPADLGGTSYYRCDLAKSAEIHAVIRQAQDEVGHPTILINNAGVVQGKSLLDLDRSELEQTFDVNVLAQFTLLKLLLPEMIRKKAGHVVTVASVFGLAADYSASKHALLGLHDSLRNELIFLHANVPIRTTLLIPGQIRTPLFASLAPPSRLVAFLAPVVTPEDIVRRVIDELERERSGVVHLPKYAAWLWSIRAAPSWVSKANEAMQVFVKADSSAERRDTRTD